MIEEKVSSGIKTYFQSQGVQGMKVNFSSLIQKVVTFFWYWLIYVP